MRRIERNALTLAASLCSLLLAAAGCNHPDVQKQTRQAGEAIKAAGKETGEAVQAAGEAAAAETKAAVDRAGDALQEAGEEAKGKLREAGREAEESAKQAGKKIGAAAEQAGENAKRTVSDAAITASIKAKLIANADVKGVEIDVDTTGARVTLRGTAKTAAQRDEAERIARSTEGVLSVDNRIVVGAK